jgi:hypothetical protein
MANVKILDIIKSCSVNIKISKLKYYGKKIITSADPVFSFRCTQRDDSTCTVKIFYETLFMDLVQYTDF